MHYHRDKYASQLDTVERERERESMISIKIFVVVKSTLTKRATREPSAELHSHAAGSNL